MSRRIGVIGSNMVDLVTTIERMPRTGETLEAPAFALGHGGKGANQAVAAARLGADVLMVSRVGDDLFGDGTIRNLEAQGIDIRHVCKVHGSTSGVAPIFVDANGNNSILIVQGANAALRPDDIDAAASDLLSCDLILLQLEIPLDTVYYAIDWARMHDRKVLLNPAPATAALDLSRISGVDFFMPNQTELATLTGLPTDTVQDAAVAAASLIAGGMNTVVVTLGSDGSLLVDSEGAQHIAPVRVTARDTTGAGDAFIGAFAAYLARGCDRRTALDAATRYAALSVTRAGTQTSFAGRQEFEAFFTEVG